jgi:hypothetical protein
MAALSFTTYFDFNLHKCRINDTTNYEGQGINRSNVKGIITVNSPRGIIYQNTDFAHFDIDPNVSTNSGWIQLPIDKLGFILTGEYTITYTINQIGDGTSQTFNTYTYTLVIPEIDITQTVDGYNSTFNSADSTNYGSAETIYRTHTVTPPSGCPLPVVSNNDQSISYLPDIWSGEWVTQITTELAYSVGGITVIGSITGTKIVTAYLNDMNVIRGYIQSFDLLYEQARAQDRNKAYKIQAGLLKIATAYEGYDLALYYNDLQTAYQRTVDIITELSDYVTITFPEEIVPFVNHQGGSGHPPVSINPSFSFGVSINASQVLSFGLATTGHGGMVPVLSGISTNYMGGDGIEHPLTGGGDVFQSQFDAFDSVRHITALNITTWNTPHADQIQSDWDATSGLGAILNKPNIPSAQVNSDWDATSGLAQILNKPTIPSAQVQTDWIATSGLGVLLNKPTIPDAQINSDWNSTSGINQILNKPTTLSGYGIEDALSTSDPAANVINSGMGGQFLTDKATYKYPVINSVSDKQVLFIDGLDTDGFGIPAGNSNLIFDKGTDKLTVLNSSIGTLTMSSEIDFTDNTVSIKRQSNDIIFTNTSTSKTLTQLISGASNYWTLYGSNIYFGTGTDRIGINKSSPTAELDVTGHIIANDFDSNFFRYKNSNLLLGPNAGDLEPGNDFVYIANTNTSTPLFKGNFASQMAEFNADVYINTVKRLCFGSSSTFIRGNTTNDLLFSDVNTNGGTPVKLSELLVNPDAALKSDFISGGYDTVTNITLANILTWNMAGILSNSGLSTNFLGEDGAYHAGSGGGVTPISNIWKWDTDHYLPYIDKTDAGGISSAGKFFGGTINPSANNRLNYDGYLYATSLYTLNNINIPITTGSSIGVIYSGSDRFMHNYGTSNLFIGITSGNFTTTGSKNIGLGESTFKFNTTGGDSVAIGHQALNNNTTGESNVAIGRASMASNITGVGNTSIGAGSLLTTSNSNYNVAIGSESLGNGLIQDYNTAVGYGTLLSNTSEKNTVIGYEAGISNITGSNNVFVGYTAGYYETGSNKLFIDGQLRSSETDARSKSLIYGLFDSSTINQFITINGKLNSLYDIEILDPSSGIILNTAFGRYKLQIDDSTPSNPITTIQQL